MRPFHACVLTAADAAQAAGYRAQLDRRRRAGALPAGTEFLVVADPGGRRAGSGGGTVHALETLRRRWGGSPAAAFKGRRVLIVHSGGDARRLPLYSPLGKVFAPLPGRAPALFDAILSVMGGLPSVAGGQLLVCSGDVLPVFDAGRVAFAARGVTGLAYPDTPAVARNFGVYVAPDPAPSGPAPVTGFLQKPSFGTAAGARALRAGGRALVDTGIFCFAHDAVALLLGRRELVRRVGRGLFAFDLYGEAAAALAGGTAPAALAFLRETPFSVSILPACDFFHVGTTADLIRKVPAASPAARLWGFRAGSRSSGFLPGSGRFFVYNSVVGPARVRCAGAAVAEGCVLDSGADLGGRNLLVGLPPGCGPVRLPRGICLGVMPLRGGLWAAVGHGVDDDFRAAPETREGRFLGRPWKEMGPRLGVGIPADPRTAALFPVSADPAEAVAAMLDAVERKPPGRWRASRRVSLEEISAAFDHRAAAAVRERARGPAACVDTPAAALAAACRSGSDFRRALRSLEGLLGSARDPLRRARILAAGALTARAARAAGVASSGWPREAVFAEVRRAVAAAFPAVSSGRPARLAGAPGTVVRAESPVRLDFAGGWTDTPPYCLERGGLVLNAGAILDGRRPVSVSGRRTAERVLRVVSIDQGESFEIASGEDLSRCADARDWLSLPKAAFAAAGTGAPRAGPLAGWLERCGGGIELVLSSGVPRGSGLGASSILGCCIVACLRTMFGLPCGEDDLVRRTLVLEQTMTTGGGWQDQVGGIVPGVKIAGTAPGPGQVPRCRPVPFPDGDPRFLLFYTGLRRRAMSILRRVVSACLERDPRVLAALASMKETARAMEKRLAAGDVAGFGRLVARSWELNKAVDPGSTTPEIEGILRRVAPRADGAKLLGAGGGGFLFIVARSASDAAAIRDDLRRRPPNPGARFHEFSVARDGLRVDTGREAGRP